MDYMDVLKRAWRITWRYRILWLFGLFVGGSGGSSGGGGGNGYSRFSSGPSGSGSEQAERFRQQAEPIWNWASANWRLLILAGVVLAFVWFLLWILSIAAGPGLVHLVREADEERPVRGRDGWATGFRYWWRNVGLWLVLFLPFLAAMLLLVGIAVAVLVPASRTGGERVLGGAILGLCCFGGLLTVVLIIAGVVAGLLYSLALRFVVLDDRPVLAAIGDAWVLFRSRFKDVAVGWLLVVAVRIGFGIVLGIIAVMLLLPAVFLYLAGNIIGAALVLLALFLVMLLPSAILGTLTSAIWTLLFLALTARGGVASATAPAPAYAPQAYEPPPPPRDAYEPPAPPAPPAPAAPPEPTAPPAPPEPPAPPAPEG